MSGVFTQGVLDAVQPVIEYQSRFNPPNVSERYQILAPSTYESRTTFNASSWSQTGTNDITWASILPGSGSPITDMYVTLRVRVTIKVNQGCGDAGTGGPGPPPAVAANVVPYQLGTSVLAQTRGASFPLFYYTRRPAVMPLTTFIAGTLTQVVIPAAATAFMPLSLSQGTLRDGAAATDGNPISINYPGRIFFAADQTAFQGCLGVQQVNWAIRDNPIACATSRVVLTVNGTELSPSPENFKTAEIMADPDVGVCYSFRDVLGRPINHPLAFAGRPMIPYINQGVGTGWGAWGQTFDSPFVPHHPSYEGQRYMGVSGVQSRMQDSVADMSNIALTGFSFYGGAPGAANDYYVEYTATIVSSIPFPPFSPHDFTQPVGNPIMDNIISLNIALQGFNATNMFMNGQFSPVLAGTLIEPSIVDCTILTAPTLTMIQQSPPSGIARATGSSGLWQYAPIYLQPGPGGQAQPAVIATAAIGTGLTAMQWGSQTLAMSYHEYDAAIANPPLQTPTMTIDVIPDMIIVSIAPSLQQLRGALYSVASRSTGFTGATGLPILRYEAIVNNSSQRGIELDMWQVWIRQKRIRPYMTRAGWLNGSYPLVLTAYDMCETAAGQPFPGPNTSGSPVSLRLYWGIPTWLMDGYPIGVDPATSPLAPFFGTGGGAAGATPLYFPVNFGTIINGIVTITAAAGVGTAFQTNATVASYVTAPVKGTDSSMPIHQPKGVIRGGSFLGTMGNIFKRVGRSALNFARSDTGKSLIGKAANAASDYLAK